MAQVQAAVVVAQPVQIGVKTVMEEDFKADISRKGPPDAGDSESGFTVLQTSISAFKAVVGPAALFNPRVFAEGGYVFSAWVLFSVYMLWAVGVYSLLSLNLLHGFGNSYGDLAHKALGRHGKIGVETCIVLQQIGIVLAYFVFIASVLQGAGLQAIDTWAIIMIVSALEVPLTVLRSLRAVRPAVMAASGICAVALVWILVRVGLDLSNQGISSTCEPFARKSWGLSIGSCVFAFEGSTALALPIHNEVRPKARAKAPVVYVGTVAIIMAFYQAFGSSGYLLFGANVQPLVINSFPDDVSTKIVQIAYAIMVFLTFPFQLFPASTVMSERFLGDRNDDIRWACGFRVLLTIALGGIAVLLRNSLDHLTALIGSLLGVPLCFIFPVLLHRNLAPQTLGTKLRNILIVICGVVATVFTTLETIRTWNESRS